MKDELFTMMGELPAMSPEVMARMKEEANRNLLRMKHFSEMVMNPTEPKVGPTPRQEIYRTNKSRLWRYESRRTIRTPLLFVPNLVFLAPDDQHQKRKHGKPEQPEQSQHGVEREAPNLEGVEGHGVKL